MAQDNKNSFCNRSLKPWIVGIVVTAFMLVFWVVMRKEEIFMGVERENIGINRRPGARPSGEPVFPGPVQQAAMNNLNSRPSVAAITKATPNGGMQLIANPMPAAITKATPNGGMQLIGGPSSDSVFQNSLKDAVNAIIPSSCDIHARWVSRSPAGKSAPADSQNLKFVPPFDGVIDKFIENKGYENIGAGVVVDKRGYVLTNYHVIQEATDVVVTVFGSPARDYRADIVAQDIQQDITLLKIRSDAPFPEAVLADSSFCQIGDYVVAVGSPFGIEQTVTSGIISGIRKSILIEGVRYKNLFQTDAPINRGSSGGPLVNLKGEVIGINTAIYAPTGVFSGTGFSIPINDCKDFLAKNLGRNYSVALDQKGMLPAALQKENFTPTAPSPVRFGIEVMPVNSVIAAKFGLEQGQGVLVNRVIEASTASFSGIQRGDIITAIAGVPITGKDDVLKIVSHFKKGDSVNVRIFRNGVSDEILLKLQ